VDGWSAQIRPGLHALERPCFWHGDTAGHGRWEDGDQEAIRAATPGAEAALDVFEQIVADNGTLLGSFTIADCAAGPVMWRSLRLPLDFSRWPKLARFRDAIASRPSFQAAEPVA
jgi:glutathione S-transferase